MIEGWTNEYCSQFDKEDCPETYCQLNKFGDCIGGDESEDPRINWVKGESGDIKEFIRLVKASKERAEAEGGGRRPRGAGVEESEEEESEEEESEEEESEESSDEEEVGDDEEDDEEEVEPITLRSRRETPLKRKISGEGVNITFNVSPNSYDFDPNSNVPRSRGLVRSIGRRYPRRYIDGRIYPRRRLRKDRIRKKPVKVVKTDPKLKKTPPTFSKVINQLLPAIFILLIFIYFVHFFKKRS